MDVVFFLCPTWFQFKLGKTPMNSQSTKFTASLYLTFIVETGNFWHAWGCCSNVNKCEFREWQIGNMQAIYLLWTRTERSSEMNFTSWRTVKWMLHFKIVITSSYNESTRTYQMSTDVPVSANNQSSNTHKWSIHSP